MEDTMKVDRVLVPLDSSPLAERAIPKALVMEPSVKQTAKSQ